MLKLTRSIALSVAALSVAVLLGAAAPPPSEATPVVNGMGAFVAADGSTIAFQVHLVQLPDGSFNGSGVSSRKGGPGGNSWFKFDVIDSMPSGSDQAVLGVITETMGAPFPVGSLTALMIQDNGQGGGTPDKMLSGSGLPSFVTIEQVLASIPPSTAWAPLASGDFVIH
jgi:hypothetical protein